MGMFNNHPIFQLSPNLGYDELHMERAYRRPVKILCLLQQWPETKTTPLRGSKMWQLQELKFFVFTFNDLVWLVRNTDESWRRTVNYHELNQKITLLFQMWAFTWRKSTQTKAPDASIDLQNASFSTTWSKNHQEWFTFPFFSTGAGGVSKILMEDKYYGKNAYIFGKNLPGQALSLINF